MPIGAKILQKFRNLKTDAQPQPPFLGSNGSYSEENANCNIEKDKFEKPESKYSKKDKKKKVYEPSPPSSPTQETGNVINIVNSSHIHVGSNITNNMRASPDADEEHLKREDCVFKTPAITALLKSHAKPEHAHLQCVSWNLGRRWKSFFRSVGYTQGHIETVEENEAAYGVQEVRYKLLLDWKRNDDDGTLGALATALWDHGDRSVVKELADLTNKQ